MSQFDGMGKMQLVSETSKTFGIGRNDCLKLTVESMKAALTAGDATLLKQTSGDAPTTTKGGSLTDALGSIGALIEATVDSKLSGAKFGVDAEEVKRLVAELMPTTTTVEMKLPSGEVVSVGAQHKRFPEVARYLANGKNIWVYGPAGSGKTEAALKFSEASAKRYALVACHRDLAPGRVVGMTNVISGDWIDGSIYELIREDGEGGIVVIDEIDRAMPSFPVALNSLLSQWRFLRNGQMERLNPATQFFVTSNTLFGATNDYTAANRQDQAFVNRFKVIQWDYDTDFEKELCRPYGTKGLAWCEWVQKVRAKAEELGCSSGKLSPRQMISGAQDIAADVPKEWTENSEVWERFSPTDRTKLKAALAA